MIMLKGVAPCNIHSKEAATMADIENMQELNLDEMAEVSGGSSDQKIKATGELNVRTGPGLNYDVVGSISTGKTLEFVGMSKKDSRGVYWYKVIYKGKERWVSSKYAKVI
jgi:uncharacterized protein YgiM (DUF1202 family)